jgi:hypothetical protein
MKVRNITIVLTICSDTYIACGFDKVPFLFKKGSNGWTFTKIIDDGINDVRKA